MRIVVVVGCMMVVHMGSRVFGDVVFVPVVHSDSLLIAATRSMRSTLEKQKKTEDRVAYSLFPIPL